MQKKNWKFNTVKYDQELLRQLSRKHSIPPIVASILLKRGMENFDDFIDPSVERLLDPYTLKGMAVAVERIISALSSMERISVYGDYDVDGITSTAVLVRFLRSRGGIVDYYIPDRLSEGYGINIPALDSIASSGTSLLITVDCGITAVNEVEYAKKIGMDVIITDHHECKEEIPSAVAVINPKQPDCPYLFDKLAGVGVVFKLLQALAIRLKMHMKELCDEYIDIVSLGTVADVMPLVGENRIIVKNGIDQLRYTCNKGLKALIKQADITAEHITTGTIGFMIAPRINAAGRIGDPKTAVELLLTDDDRVAEKIAKQLDDENRDRQASEQQIFDEVISILDRDHSYEKDAVLVLAGKGWHHGIIGIVASKIVEKFHKPCLLISLDQELGKGSGRSIKPFNLFAGLSACEEDLVKFGGHELAAGLTIHADAIENFRNKINAYAKQTLKDCDYTPELHIDAELPLIYMNLNTVEKFSVMTPYGMGNPGPVFLCRNLRVSGIRTMSDGKHLRLTLTDGNYTVYAVGFSMGELSEEIEPGDYIDIVFNLDTNVYKGEKRVQILLIDMRFSPQSGEYYA